VIGLPSLQAMDRSQGARIWMASEATDMRCGFDRLAERVNAVNLRRSGSCKQNERYENVSKNTEQYERRLCPISEVLRTTCSCCRTALPWCPPYHLRSIDLLVGCCNVCPRFSAQACEGGTLQLPLGADESRYTFKCSRTLLLWPYWRNPIIHHGFKGRLQRSW
jgi:hypothetical protein